MNELHQTLMCCDSYPEPTSRVDYIETHISSLYLTDRLVYKIKKSVDFGFCNFTSLDRRRFYCEEEVRLNRRLAPSTYLGVSRIVRQSGKFLIDQAGEACEYAVRMRRLPESRMLARLLTDERDSAAFNTDMRTIGQLLARFHQQTPRIDSKIHAEWQMMKSHWQQNFDQTRQCPEGLIRPLSFELLEQLVCRYLQQNIELFESRQRRGFVRDGHGDLHCEHICLTEPLQIFDCIEFNSDLRYGDILNDLAFLIMDLEFKQKPDLAAQLWTSYRAEIETGQQASSLLRFYALYRAWVRAKVHYFQAGISGGELFHQTLARDYFRRASCYALPQLLLLCCGMIGSGKSTLAGDLAKTLGATVLSSDQIRQRRAGGPAENTGYAEGPYSPDQRLEVYRQMAERAADILTGGRSLIIDATFENQQMRRLFLTLAEERRIPVFFLITECSEAELRKRLRKRHESPESAGRSEAGLLHYERQRTQFEPFPAQLRQFRVDTGQHREYNVDFLLEKLLSACGTLS